MNKKLCLSALLHTLFSVLLGIFGVLTPLESKAVFSLIGLYIVQPLAALLSAVPFGFHACSGLLTALYTAYAAFLNQAVHWAAVGDPDAEALLITGALTVIGTGIGDYLKNKRNTKNRNIQ